MARMTNVVADVKFLNNDILTGQLVIHYDGMCSLCESNTYERFVLSSEAWNEQLDHLFRRLFNNLQTYLTT